MSSIFFLLNRRSINHVRERPFLGASTEALTFPLICGRACGGVSNEDFPPVLRETLPLDGTGLDICCGALMFGRPFCLVLRDMPLESDILLCVCKKAS